MPYVTCPSCTERGKIPANLVGARIKCKKCGVSFMVSPPSPKATAGAATGGSGTAFPAAVVEAPGGIEVEGLDASSWSLSTDVGVALKAEAQAEPTADAESRAEPSSAFVPAGPAPGGAREYKLLTPKDKFFDGKFELPRLEEALNHYARQGWSVKAVSTPHVKGFSGALEEWITVLLER
jgi:hypothetical protein